ncbi:hypothetical protein KP814_31695, partial [Hahella sp. HN01]|nr:hypothetical protein [Hahella sp. HN01]
MIEPNDMSDVAVLAQPVEDKHANLLALLADGEAWSSASIALALGMSQRTVFSGIRQRVIRPFLSTNAYK